MTDQQIIDYINADFEPVVILKDGNFLSGRRGNKTLIMGGCFGRMSVDKNGNLYHSMIHSSVKSYSHTELRYKLEKSTEETNKISEALELFN